MDPIDALVFKILGSIALAVGMAVTIDLLSLRRGLQPPGFTLSAEREADLWWLPAVRRVLGGGAIAVVLWVGVFGSLVAIGSHTEIDFSALSSFRLFQLHAYLLIALAAWYLLGFAGTGGERSGSRWGRWDWLAQFGLRARSVWRELGLGVLAGVGAWLFVILAAMTLGLVLMALGQADALPQTPPPVVPFIAGLPWATRLLISLSAGVVEETFFRGFLQPRVGIGLSTGLFVLAHANYEQPFMLVGIGLLSLVFAFLVRWRQSIWAAITAHAFFDAIQLLIVIPSVLKVLGGGS